MKASEYISAIGHPIVFYVSLAHPSGVSVAILPDTQLPFDLDEITGEIDDDIFRADLAGTDFSDDNGNTVTRINIYSSEEEWTEQEAEYNEGF